MRYKKIFLMFFTAVNIVNSGMASNNYYPSWIEKSVFYQIYPQSFKDSDGDGIGDLNGITQKLDYFSKLGINAIWLTPIFESPFMDAGYDVQDFYKIAPRYGSEKDLINLIKKAHKRKIKVVLDLVAGHTSDQHAWFKKSQQNTKNEFSDFYIWTDNKGTLPEKYVTGDYPRNGNFMKNFFDCQPALNFGFAKPSNPWEQTIDAPGPKRVQQELKNIIDFWMKKGVDGFRVDMASSLIKNDKNFVETTRFWKAMSGWFREQYPEGVLIAEWSNPKEAIHAGFMIDFMMHFNVPGYPSMFFNQGGVFQRDTCYFDLQGNGSPMEFISNYMEQIKSVGEKGFVSVPSSNHDINRLNSGNRTTVEQLKAAMTFLLTLKGIPFIYYGEEIGMRFLPGLPDKEGSVLTNYENRNRAGTRTPMQWNSGRNAGFSTASPDKLYLPIDNTPDAPTVSNQLNDKNSLFNFVKNLLQLRLKYPALGNNGDIKFLNSDQTSYPLCYVRTAGNEKMLVVINPSGSNQNINPFAGETVGLHPILSFKTNIVEKQNSTFIETGVSGYAIYRIETK
jgi:maltose alpha-D-glucosyltransferase / alpha-amylase